MARCGCGGALSDEVQAAVDACVALADLYTSGSAASFTQAVDRCRAAGRALEPPQERYAHVATKLGYCVLDRREGFHISIAEAVRRLNDADRAKVKTHTVTVGPHKFVGRLDRWCEVCNRPDRDPIHVGVAEPADADRERRRTP